MFFSPKESVFFKPFHTKFLSARLTLSFRSIMKMRSRRRRPSPENQDGNAWEGCWENCASSRVLWHYLRKLEDLLLGKSTRPAVATYWYLPIGRTRVTTWARLPMSIDWKWYILAFQLNHHQLRFSFYLKVLIFFVLLPRRQANYNLILIVDRLKKMLRNKLVQIS